MSELINNAFTGVNIIPSVLLGLVLLYWITLIFGVFDFDLFDIDIDLNAADSLGAFHEILIFLNIGDLPFMLVFSIIVLNFWVISMLIVPIVPGGIVKALVLIAIIIISAVITKIITSPLKGFFKKVYEEKYNLEEAVVGKLVRVVCNLKYGDLGQAEIKRDGAPLLVNVKVEYEEQTFEKNEEAYINKKDENKNLYYIIKIKE